MNFRDFRVAVAFLTVLPISYPVGGKPGYSFSYFPVVGLILGAILFTVAQLPLVADIRAFLIVLVWIVLTGGLHLDGFADSCDGLFATVEPERRLEIMKDPRTGVWAVVGLVMLLLGKWIMVQQVDPFGLLLAPIAGRWSMVIAAYGFPYARPKGMGGYFRDGLGQRQARMATILAVMICTIVSIGVGPAWLVILIVVPVMTNLLGFWAARRLNGGLTGDVYGALCEVVELVSVLICRSV